MHVQLLLLLLSVHCRWAVGLAAGAVADAVLLAPSTPRKHLLLLLLMLLLLLVDAAAAGACCSICCSCSCRALACSWSSFAAEA
jgi:hypothetical protein